MLTSETALKDDKFMGLSGPGNQERVRRDYAEMIRQKGRIRSERLVRALAEVPREDFLGKGPWKLVAFIDSEMRTEDTPDDNPAHVYADVAIRIDPAREANNGHARRSRLLVGCT